MNPVLAQRLADVVKDGGVVSRWHGPPPPWWFAWIVGVIGVVSLLILALVAGGTDSYEQRLKAAKAANRGVL